MKRLLPPLIALVLLTVIFLFTDGSPVPPNSSEGVGAAQPGEVTSRPPAVLDRESSVAGGAGAVGGSGTQVTPGGARAAAVDLMLGAVAEGSFQVVVRHPRTKGVMRDAKVSLFDRTTTAAQLEWARSSSKPGGAEQLLRTSGTIYPCDEQGVAVVPQILNGVVYASCDGYEGWYEWIGPIEGPLMLEMREGVDLVVEVVDGAGRSMVNVPVAICVNDRKNPRSLMETASTPPAGLARFRRVQAGLANRASGSGYAVRLALPIAGGELVPIDPENLPTEPIRLTCPPVGRLIVHVVDGEGELIEHVDVSIGTMGSNALERQEVFVAEEIRRNARGFARFEMIPVGSQPFIRLTGDATRPELVEMVEGPPAEGETSEVTVVWDGRFPTIVARLLDEQGRPLAARTGRMQLLQDGVGRGGAPVQTDAEGRFQAPVQSIYANGTKRLARFEVFTAQGEPPYLGELDLSYHLRDGETNLGDVVLRGLPLLASGRVMSEGRPVAGAQVRPAVRRMTKLGQEWSPVGGLVASTAADGTFTLYGEVEAEGPYGLAATSRGFSMKLLESVQFPVLDALFELTPGDEEGTFLRGAAAKGERGGGAGAAAGGKGPSGGRGGSGKGGERR